MKFIFIIVAIAFSLNNAAYCQSPFTDSIMTTRVTDSLVGKPKIYYTPGYKQRALQFLDIFSKATKFYEHRYHTLFNYRMAVLDSSQWIYEKYPFGFLAYDSGWVFLPAVVNSPFFTSIYGFTQDTSDLNNYLQQKNLTTTQLSDAVYYVYSLHELGHYFTDDNEQVIIPDMFANEMIATYFSYCYFKSTNNPALQKLINFSSFIKTHYHPRYRNIEAMDSLYMSMPIQNFKWFHCNIVLLCQQVYNSYGFSFIDYYLQTFRAGTINHFTTQQVINLLDKKCKGKVNAWASNLKEEK
jgi:hypothetical protein